jgi:hypothetical protein
VLENPVITLTTDFSLKDPFVAMMKGVILGINPKANIVDITHNITRHNIAEASQTLSMSYRYFPDGAIHIAVVDPGVGSSRRPIMVVTESQFFIGPDNGIFSSIINEAGEDTIKVIHITEDEYFLSKTGATFHGRDIFAPVAAWLSKGLEAGQFGERINDYLTINIPEVTFSESSSLTGEIISIDSFGNAISNITRDNLSSLDSSESGNRLMVSYNNAPLSLLSFYAESKGSALSAIINSSGYLELFVNRRSAADNYHIKVGDKVTVSRTH